MEGFVELYNRIVREEDGQGMVEYALIAGLVSIAAIAVIVLIGPQLLEAFQGVTDGLTDGGFTGTTTTP